MEYNLSDLERWNDKIESLAKSYGLDYYPQEYEIIGYDEMLSHEAYLGMPSRYPHWSFGKAYEKNKMLYSFNLTGLPYEMVINSNPCIAYLMRDNTLLLQILTMAHVYGHNDFFKNNRLFKEGTDARNTIEIFKLDADIIREYINDPDIGYDKVEHIIDAAHSIRFQVCRAVGFKEITEDESKKNMMQEYIRKVESRNVLNFNDEIKKPDFKKFPLKPQDDVLKFIINYGHLKEWEKQIIEVVRRESLYFMPQIETKIMNEGWASYTHYNLLKQLELPQSLYIEFIKRHNDVIAAIPGTINPYYIGFKIFEDIEKRYGKEKIFEVRALERDNSFLRKYLTEELCRKLGLFQYKKKGYEYVVTEVSDKDGWEAIRDSLINDTGISGIPYIRVKNLDMKNFKLTLEHVFDGRALERSYAVETLKNIYKLWRYPVRLETFDIDGNKTVILCEGDNVSIE